MPATHPHRQTAALQALKTGAAARKRRFEAGTTGDLWHRLVALDIINQAFVFAATLLVCAFPFLIFLETIRNESFAASVSRHMGLDAAGAAQVEALFRPGAGTQVAVSIGTIAFLVLGILAVATSLQALYARIFGFEPRDLKAFWRKPVWVASTLAGGSAVNLVNGALHGAPVFAHLLNVLVVIAYFWWALHFLLENRLSWRYLLPAGIGTGLFWAGLTLFSRFYFSSAVVSSGKQYGPIGVVFVLMSWLIALGVVIALGAVVGAVWRERHRTDVGAAGGSTGA